MQDRNEHLMRSSHTAIAIVPDEDLVPKSKQHDSDPVTPVHGLHRLLLEAVAPVFSGKKARYLGDPIPELLKIGTDPSGNMEEAVSGRSRR